MPLYKATEKGNVQMTAEEEAQLRADWAAAEARKLAEVAAPVKKTLEERVTDLEVALAKLGSK